MNNTSKAKGTWAEGAAGRYLTGITGEKFERQALAGSGDIGDLRAHGVPVTVEVKNTKVCNLRQFGRELARECANGGTHRGVVIWSPPGMGKANVHRWLAIDWAGRSLTPTPIYSVPLTAPINQLHKVVDAVREWGPVLMNADGGTPRPTESNWIRAQTLEAWAHDLAEQIANWRRYPPSPLS